MSFGWISWVGAAESLELLDNWRTAGAIDEPVALARDLAGRLGVEWGGGTLVCPQIDDVDEVRAALAEHRIKAAFRGTAARFSTHVYNDASDIEQAAGDRANVRRCPYRPLLTQCRRAAVATYPLGRITVMPATGLQAIHGHERGGRFVEGDGAADEASGVELAGRDVCEHHGVVIAAMPWLPTISSSRATTRSIGIGAVASGPP